MSHAPVRTLLFPLSSAHPRVFKCFHCSDNDTGHFLSKIKIVSFLLKFWNRKMQRQEFPLSGVSVILHVCVFVFGTLYVSVFLCSCVCASVCVGGCVCVCMDG